MGEGVWRRRRTYTGGGSSPAREIVRVVGPCRAARRDTRQTTGRRVEDVSFGPASVGECVLGDGGVACTSSVSVDIAVENHGARPGSPESFDAPAEEAPAVFALVVSRP